LRHWFLAKWIVVAIGTAMTIGGLVAPFYAPLEMLNHYRPLTLVGCILFLIPTLRESRLAGGLLAGLLLTNVGVLATAGLSHAALAAADTKKSFTVVAFNVWRKNTDYNQVADWLLTRSIDVIVLMEMTPNSKAIIIPKLKSAFPNVFDCDCNDMVIFSKRPPIETGGQTRTTELPSMTWMRFLDDANKTYRVIGIRPHFAMHPHFQRAQYEWINTEVPKFREPVIMAGDFNATPWSWNLWRLSEITGLVRHGTWKASWSARWPMQLFLLDNVLSTPDIKSILFETGPWLGSDHLPVIATVALP
jgi:endonuclease/exonuclease/phosphatase (EEP) superfamily protein YafD